MSLGNIIRKRRKQLKLTLDEIAEKVGFSKPYLSTIETGKVKNSPSDSLLVKLEKALSFDSGILIQIAHIENLPADIRIKIKTAEAENQKLKQIVRNIINKKKSDFKIESVLSDSNIDLDSNSNEISSGQSIPIINKVAAGYPQDFNDLDYPVGIADDYVRCPDVNDPNAFAVCVIGDSMEPKFLEGDIVVFSPRSEIRNGDDCFIRFKEPHETTFKRVYFEKDGLIRLQPRNDKYNPVMIKSDRLNGIYRAIRTIQNI